VSSNPREITERYLGRVLIEQRPSDDSELTALVVDQQAELRVRDGGLESQLTRVDPTARYLVAVLGGDAVACGAVQTLDIDTAELKRMYVRPAYRGRGIAKRMLRALEEFAASRGHAVVRLETGVYFLESIALYLSSGYRPIPRFGQYLRNEYSRCFEKRLDGTDRSIRLVRSTPNDAAVAELAEPVDPTARFVVALVDDKPVGCGAIQPVDDQTVELKRMYVHPAHHDNGIAGRLLAALEDLAAGSHYRVIRLETGIRQPEAVGLYESAGYRPIPAYGPYAGNPLSRCYEKLVIAIEPIASEST
jgi:putative acetyltransferase